MRVSLWPSSEVRTLRSRRGNNTYRPREVPPRERIVDYPALTNSILELVDDGVVVGTINVTQNINSACKMIPTDDAVETVTRMKGEPDDSENQSSKPKSQEPVEQATKENEPTPAKENEPTQAKEEKADSDSEIKQDVSVDVQRSPEKSDEDSTGTGSAEKDDDSVQQMERESDSDGASVSGSVSVPVSPVDEGDARLGSSDERGSESGSDGVHSDPAESEPVHDRSSEEERPVPSSDEDSGRNRFQRYEI